MTLIELLTVILLLGLLSAIALGTLMHQKADNSMLATEQMISDLIRQAIHTARSTGGPVVLTIQQVDATDPTLGWTVAGVSRSCIWSESWDDTAQGTRPVPTIGIPGITIGLSGNGLTGIPSETANTHLLEPRDQLVRGQHQDGFYLACAFRIVSDQLLPANAPKSVLESALPLVLIGSAGNDMVSGSLAGLMLLPYRPQLQPQPQAAAAGAGAGNPVAPGAPGGLGNPAPGLPSPPSLHCFELIGWVSPYDPSGTPPPEPNDEVSSIQTDSLPTVADPNNPGGLLPIARDQQPLHPSFPANTPNIDAAGPIGLDHWEEVGLLFDGGEMTLYRNGQRVGQRIYSAPANSLPGQMDTIYIGQASVPGGAGAVTTGNNVVFDDVRLYRLGTDVVGQLPGGVVPAQPYRISVHPDGRVELLNSIAQVGVRGGGGMTVALPQGGTETISVQSRNALIFSLQPHGQATHSRHPNNAAVITITASGTVASSLATWELSATGTDYPVLDNP